MNGGDGPNSYARNSSNQRNGATTALTMIEEAIPKELDLKQHFPSKSGEPFRIADLGCSVGPNTFLLVGATIEAVKLKYQYCEFQAFFNDVASNDFNTLLRSHSWDDPDYFAAVVPGSFHGRLFPRVSLHFVLCFYSLQWMSRLPKEAITDECSPAWNKGKITCFGANRDVSAAFLRQFAVDIDSFLRARAEETVVGGLMALVIPYQGGCSDQKPIFLVLFDLLEAVLSDMVILGRLDEIAVDSFNLPVYLPIADEFMTLVEENGSFSLVMLEPITVPKVAFDARVMSSGIRAIVEERMRSNFPSEIMDEIFDRTYADVNESEIRHFVIENLVPSLWGLQKEF
ncbi:hypothetical protein H6P81_009002 [Aristolochia fimbriata]|uniref:S-adenosylmethionine-dependent methyltransferase n=1 Tax=Aristolochia fimbriata TaxID=158543 RepID=A0AAV7EN39_ARIFI|nr:hypothetical protein H6P81_009002 [Aristolochia fimbriata]